MKTKFPSRFCSICGGQLIGRSDKVFCSIDCKNEYHKQRRHQYLPKTKLVDSFLHRNWVVLAELHERVGGDKFHVPMSDLIDSGFTPKYHTTTEVNAQGKTYHYIYNYGWMQFSAKEVLIVHQDDPK